MKPNIKYFYEDIAVNSIVVLLALFMGCDTQQDNYDVSGKLKEILIDKSVVTFVSSDGQISEVSGGLVMPYTILLTYRANGMLESYYYNYINDYHWRMTFDGSNDQITKGSGVISGLFPQEEISRHYIRTGEVISRIIDSLYWNERMFINGVDTTVEHLDIESYNYFYDNAENVIQVEKYTNDTLSTRIEYEYDDEINPLIDQPIEFMPDGDLHVNLELIVKKHNYISIKKTTFEVNGSVDIRSNHIEYKYSKNGYPVSAKCIGQSGREVIYNYHYY